MIDIAQKILKMRLLEHGIGVELISRDKPILSEGETFAYGGGTMWVTNVAFDHDRWTLAAKRVNS